jgi:hypothetical protein
VLFLYKDLKRPRQGNGKTEVIYSSHLWGAHRYTTRGGNATRSGECVLRRLLQRAVVCRGQTKGEMINFVDIELLV